jgi:hypothetical protein
MMAGIRNQGPKVARVTKFGNADWQELDKYVD